MASILLTPTIQMNSTVQCGGILKEPQKRYHTAVFFCKSATEDNYKTGTETACTQTLTGAREKVRISI